MVKQLFFLVIGMFAIGCNTFQIPGLLPQIGHTIGEPMAITAQGIAAFSLTYLFSTPLFSVMFANKSIKPTIQFALVVFTLGNLITIISHNIGSFIIGRALAGIGAGMFMPLGITVALHSVNASAKGRALSVVWGANSAGVVFGIPIAVSLSSLFNWQLSIAYIMILSVVALVGISFKTVDLILPSPGSLKDRVSLFVDKKTRPVLGITCVTALASLGLFSYVIPIQAGSPHSVTLIMFSWGLGGFIGSALIGFFTDRIKKTEVVMVVLLQGLILSFISIPFIKHLPYLGLIPFFMWGVFGWAVPNPQQKILFERHQAQGAIVAAMNSSALGLGSVLGTMLGGVIMTYGFKGINLPLSAAAILVSILFYQLKILKNGNRECST